ncbi:hypothetical protein V502_08152 [Pseudogymnoascus sp. VKM F-4520 (FW-2644)]|nr:hypothetical protein V502_08152 [Pseudogymnoascus sp. VKM F-4520 (FW-2644)]
MATINSGRRSESNRDDNGATTTAHYSWVTAVPHGDRIFIPITNPGPLKIVSAAADSTLPGDSPRSVRCPAF